MATKYSPTEKIETQQEMNEKFRSKQAIFDYVADRLFEQKVGSYRETYNPKTGRTEVVCCFRDDLGHACAAGHLMTDEFINLLEDYDEISTDVFAITERLALRNPVKDPVYLEGFQIFITKLQIAHDESCTVVDNRGNETGIANPKQFITRLYEHLARIAREENLKTGCLDQYCKYLHIVPELA